MANETKSTHLIIPEVLADMVQVKLEKKVRFTPLAIVDTTLVGKPGDTITVPAYDYIGEATDLTEGESVDITQMSTTKKTMKVKQTAKAVEITDYALEVGFDDALAEAANQLALSIADKQDNDMVTAIKGATLNVTATGGLTVDNLELAIAKFEDEDGEPMVLLANPKNALVLQADARKKLLNTEVGATSLINGAFARVLNAEVIRTKRLEDNEAYLVKVGALRLIKKRDLQIEKDRDILKFSTVISTNAIYGTYLYDAKKVVKINVN